MLRDQTGQEVSLGTPVLIDKRDRSLVVRCAVSGLDGTRSVVIKRNEGDDARGFTDWASLVFLTGVESAVGVAPRFHAGDLAQRILVMEDLGGSHSLEDLLENGNVASVRRALKAMAIPMARLVAATLDREGEFEGIRNALPGAEALGRWREAERWIAGFEQIQRWSQALDVRLPSGFRAAFECVAEVYAQPDRTSPSHMGIQPHRIITSRARGYASWTSSMRAIGMRCMTLQAGMSCAPSLRGGLASWRHPSGESSQLGRRGR